MIKVLVANENKQRILECCQYLSNNNPELKIIGANTGIDTLKKYNEMKIDVLILNSHFSDIKATEIIDRLSITDYERNKNNIILTINSKKEQTNFTNTAKIYRIFRMSKSLEELSNIVREISYGKKYNNIDDECLNKLLYSMWITLGSLKTEILKDAIYECYNFPYLLNNFDSVLNLLSFKYRTDTETIRNAIRSTLGNLNKYKHNLQNHDVVKMFEPDKNISPKAFLEVVVSYLHFQKNQEIIF